MNSQPTAVRRNTQARPELFYVKRNFAPEKPSTDMVRRLLQAHQAA